MATPQRTEVVLIDENPTVANLICEVCAEQGLSTLRLENLGELYRLRDLAPLHGAVLILDLSSDPAAVLEVAQQLPAPFNRPDRVIVTSVRPALLASFCTGLPAPPFAHLVERPFRPNHLLQIVRTALSTNAGLANEDPNPSLDNLFLADDDDEEEEKTITRMATRLLEPLDPPPPPPPIQRVNSRRSRIVTPLPDDEVTPPPQPPPSAPALQPVAVNTNQAMPTSASESLSAPPLAEVAITASPLPDLDLDLDDSSESPAYDAHTALELPRPAPPPPVAPVIALAESPRLTKAPDATKRPIAAGNLVGIESVDDFSMGDDLEVINLESGDFDLRSMDLRAIAASAEDAMEVDAEPLDAEPMDAAPEGPSHLDLAHSPESPTVAPGSGPTPRPTPDQVLSDEWLDSRPRWSPLVFDDETRTSPLSEEEQRLAMLAVADANAPEAVLAEDYIDPADDEEEEDQEHTRAFVDEPPFAIGEAQQQANDDVEVLAPELVSPVSEGQADLPPQLDDHEGPSFDVAAVPPQAPQLPANLWSELHLEGSLRLWSLGDILRHFSQRPFPATIEVHDGEQSYSLFMEEGLLLWAEAASPDDWPDAFEFLRSLSLLSEAQITRLQHAWDPADKSLVEIIQDLGLASGLMETIPWLISQTVWQAALALDAKFNITCRVFPSNSVLLHERPYCSLPVEPIVFEFMRRYPDASPQRRSPLQARFQRAAAPPVRVASLSLDAEEQWLMESLATPMSADGVLEIAADAGWDMDRMAAVLGRLCDFGLLLEIAPPRGLSRP